MEKLIIENKEITIFGNEEKNSPLIILNTVMGEGEKVYNECLKLGAENFILCCIGNLNWDDDMTPWQAPAISENDTPCSGKADEYLKILTEKIIPAIKEKFQYEPKYLAIAGYSLAGLFAIYSLYKTDIFKYAASASGSFWYPNFVDFIKNNKTKIKPNGLYFSLGDTEKNSKIKILQSVQNNTEQIYEYFKQQNINTIFELNKGNHFTQTTSRMAKGITWLLQNN